MIIKKTKNELLSHRGKPDIIKIWYIKEILQTYILKQIYEMDSCKNLIFYWGTSLRFLFWLNRLSEDLDFISSDFHDFESLGSELSRFFQANDIPVTIKIQKFRIILNFKDFLSVFWLQFGASNDLYIKIEISDNFAFCKNFETKLYPIFKFDTSLVLRSLDQSSLFSTKINAVLYRNWEKQVWSSKLQVKWRDIYDLFWYLSHNITPNIDCIDGVESIEELKEKLLQIIERIDFSHVILDIENYLEDRALLSFMKDNAREYLNEKISLL